MLTKKVLEQDQEIRKIRDDNQTTKQEYQTIHEQETHWKQEITKLKQQNELLQTTHTPRQDIPSFEYIYLIIYIVFIYLLLYLLTYVWFTIDDCIRNHKEQHQEELLTLQKELREKVTRVVALQSDLESSESTLSAVKSNHATLLEQTVALNNALKEVIYWYICKCNSSHRVYLFLPSLF